VHGCGNRGECNALKKFHTGLQIGVAEDYLKPGAKGAKHVRCLSLGLIA
jgi:hypothetical protein